VFADGPSGLDKQYLHAQLAKPEEWKSASGESLIRGGFQSVGECPRPTTGSIRLGSRRSKWEPECTLCCVDWPIATMGCARTRAPAQALRPSTPTD
jgi:hypothetical protein